MKKIISLLLAAAMLPLLAGCGIALPWGSPSLTAESLPDHYRFASYYNEDGSLATIDQYDSRGHFLNDEVYEWGVLSGTEEFRSGDAFTYLEAPEVKENSEVVSVEYRQLFVRTADEVAEFVPSNMVYVFGYDQHDRMKTAKVFVLNDDGSVLYDFIITYDLDDLGNFNGWTHRTENGDVLLAMTADNVYEGEKLTRADYHYARYGYILYEDENRFEALEEPSTYTLNVVFEY